MTHHRLEAGTPRAARRARLMAPGALALAALCLVLSLVLVPGAARSQEPSTPGARVYFISPADHSVVTSPLIVRFGLSGMGVAPAGVKRAGTGHHHLIIDAATPPPGMPIPSNDHYRHFGGGQTETLLELTPGKHVLQLILGDHGHIPHQPPVISKKITITVK